MVSPFPSLSSFPTAVKDGPGVCGGSRPSLPALFRQLADGILGVEQLVQMGVCKKVIELYLASPLTMACVRVRDSG